MCVAQPDGQDSYDMSVFYDDLHDDAYLVRSVGNKFAGISKLTSDFSKYSVMLQ